MKPDFRRPIITLTTDFGTTDHYVGAVKGAILSHAPEACLVDITHECPAHDIAAAAWILANVFDAFPRGTCHLAVVDPGVGTERRGLIAVAGGQFLVGPDNGIFSHVFEAHPPSEVHAIEPEAGSAGVPSATFHARDIFGPVAARIVTGTLPASLGRPCRDPHRIPAPDPVPGPDGGIRATVIHIDRFGNVVLNLNRARAVALLGPESADRLVAVAGPARIDRMVRTYGDAPVGTVVLLWNSSGYLEIGAHRRRADRLAGCSVGDPVDVRARRS